MRNGRLRTALVTSTLVGIGVVATASIPATQSTRVVHGRITKAGDSVSIAQVRVSIVGSATGVVTTNDGRFRLPNVDLGTRQLRVLHPCYFESFVTLPPSGDVIVNVGLPFDGSSLRRAGCGGLGSSRK